MKTLHAKVSDKKLEYRNADGAIVCGNNDYKLEFEFDEEWDAHDNKKARFFVNGEYKDVAITGNVCSVPVVSKVGKIEVGVYVPDELATTADTIPCALSCLCKDATAGFVPQPKLAKVRLTATIPEAAPWDSFTIKVFKYNNGNVVSETLVIYDGVTELENIIVGSVILDAGETVYAVTNPVGVEVFQHEGNTCSLIVLDENASAILGA